MIKVGRLLGLYQGAPKGWLHTSFAILLAIILNVAILPAESAGEYGEQYSLFVRASAWLCIVGLSSFFFKLRRTKYTWLLSLGYLTLFMFANIGNSGASLRWLLYVFVMVLGAAIVQTAVVRSVYFRGVFVRSMELVILTWVSFFAAQIIVFFATGDVVDFHRIFIPYSEQRTEILVAGFARLGGLHIEPGTYANWLYGLVLIRGLYLRKIFDRFSMIAMCSVPLTASFWGLLSFLCFVGAGAAYQGIGRLSKVLSGLIFVSIVILGAVQFEIGGGFIAYVSDRLTLEDNSSQAKVQAYAGFTSNLREYVLIGKEHDYDFCAGCYSPQDAGVFLNTVVKIGLIGALLLFVGFYRGVFLAVGVSGIIAALPVLFAKWYYWDNVFWLLLLASSSWQSKRPKLSRLIPSVSPSVSPRRI